MGNIFPRRKRGKIQPPPAVHADSTKKPEHAAGFMLPMGPQPGKAGRKLCIW